ncbi:MAG: T9SS type A sorting domain-containing protein [Bacteroidia bacterium]|jgi:Zn-dependent metalloprotease|nr:T9SS type A sorting domain-containing protein [Bacteroidia bacterium]
MKCALNLLSVLAVSAIMPLNAIGQNASNQKGVADIRIAVNQQLESRALVDFSPKQIPLSETAPAEAIAKHYTQTHRYLQLPDVGMQLVHQTQSRIGYHYLYQQTYKGIPIWGATLKVNTNANQVTLSVFDKLVETSGWPSAAAIGTSKKAFWIANNGSATIAFEQLSPEGYVLSDADGNLIYERPAAFNLFTPDTPATALVFLPDPLTPQGVIYGQNGTYQHYNDSDYALINDAREEVTIPVTFANGLFTLQNQYARVVDLRSPFVAPATSNTPTFNYLRSQSGFKDAMALYHITHTQLYFQSLGFNQLKQYTIKVDAHSGSDDNSSFNFGDTSLNFGTGGVPDAEDGDVISHEYTHALSFFINPSPNMSSERRAIEEAMCDVIAAIQSKKYTEYNWRKLFNWDGPNPRAAGVSGFWGGRDGQTSRTYANITGNPYRDCEIWTSTLLDITNEIGLDSTAMLMLETISSMTESTTMPEAATLFMQADSILLGSYFSWKMGRVFNERGLGNFPTSIQSVSQLAAAVSLNNTFAFANGTGSAVLDLTAVQGASVAVYNVQGQIIYQYPQAPQQLEFNPQLFAAGMYVVRVTSALGSVQLKLLRAN